MAHPSLIMPAYGKCVGTWDKAQATADTYLEPFSMRNTLDKHTRPNDRSLPGVSAPFAVSLMKCINNLCNEEAHWLVDKVTSHRGTIASIHCHLVAQ